MSYAKSSSRKTVSIVVTTKNSAKFLRNCLQSIKEQTYKDIQLIVVDNKSTDDTYEIACAYTKEVYDQGPERSAQRNYGLLKQAHGEYAMYVDSDMILSPNLVESCVKDYVVRRPAGIYVKEIVLGRSFFSRVRNFERGYYDNSPIDAVRFFGLDDFKRVNGFDEALFVSGSGEDWDLDKKLKSVGDLVPLNNESKVTWRQWSLETFVSEHTEFLTRGEACLFHDEIDFEPFNYCKKKTYYAEGFEGYVAKWGKNDPDIKYQLGFFSRYFQIYFSKRGVTRSISHPILFMGMYSLKILVGLFYILSKMKGKLSL